MLKFIFKNDKEIQKMINNIKCVGILYLKRQNY